MKTRRFGKSDWDVSEVSFGAWAIGGGWGEQKDEESMAALNKALDLGVNFIDTAAGYGAGKSERIIGEVLKHREGSKVYVATKTPPQDGAWPPSPYDEWNDRYPEKYLRENIDERRTNLQTDVIDLLQLHTWTRAWNGNPKPFEILRKIQQEGTIRQIGVSTPEYDQNSVIDLMRGGWVDSVQVIYNIFEQEPAAELLPVAKETGTAIIVRVAFDEGALTGKFTRDSTFAEDDFRRNYFAGDRLERTVDRVDRIKADINDSELSMPEVALKFVLAHPAVSTVIPGMRRVSQAEANCAVSDKPDLDADLLETLRGHRWNRAFWYTGK